MIDEISLLVDRLRRGSAFETLRRALTQATNPEKKHITLERLMGSAPALVTHALSQELTGDTIVCILPDEETAAYFYSDLLVLSDLGSESETALYFPSLYDQGVKYGKPDAANELLRTETLSRLIDGTAPRLVVTYPEALVQGIVDKELFKSSRLSLKVGETVDDRRKLRQKLWDMGFEETDYVFLPGQFAVRGSLIDIYSFAYEKPVRIDFFGDEIESIKPFEPESQLSAGPGIEAITILASFRTEARSGESLFSLLPRERTILYIDRYSFLRDSLAQAHNALATRVDTDPEAEAPAPHALSLIESEKLLKEIRSIPSILARHPSTDFSGLLIDFEQSPEPLFHKNFDLLATDLQEMQARHYETMIMSGQKSQIKRLQEILQAQKRSISFTPIYPTLHQGFTDHACAFCCYTDHSIFERFHRHQLKSERIRSRSAILSLKEIQKYNYGDYIVHSSHGVGMFAGLFTIEQNGKKQEVIRLNYRDGDSIYVSIHSLHHLSKYKGNDVEDPPKLSKLGSGAWDKLKERTKKKVKDIARDLIRLYAKRLEEKGFAFSPDTYMQQELEASFLYEDTPDQQAATAQVKADMERPIPMDRLICGDVGFGKTEIAIRAAFKAVADGKQVALLVPTTLLAYQHYLTFKRRLESFPCRVEYLSRTKTTHERRLLLQDLSEGQIDIIIGTHALVNDKVKFRDLGLLIIDEEQKFGVAVKEKLRRYRAHIDTLTMSATPIPRTLQFSLMGARDLSNILTPPPNRQPVRTIHSTFDKELIRETISYELARGGQVFFVHNRIHNIHDIAASIHSVLPEVRIAVAHGQLNPKELEDTIIDFVNHEYDVLLSTAIVENGIDLPNANTIIINDAHRFGLSDLHQLRGRVGRSNIKGYCYLLTPPLEILTPEAKRRIQGITTFTDLGSGMQIALQDLNIRGAGNLLGSEQSGFIADLGYETYRRVLEEAVMELKNGEFADLQNPFPPDPSETDSHEAAREYVYECNIETDVPAFFPATYVPGDNERIALYSELDRVTSPAALTAYAERLQDRFGALPGEAASLLEIVRLKMKGKSMGVEKIFLHNNRLKLQLTSDYQSTYYKSAAFSKLLSNACTWGESLRFQDSGGKRTISIKGIASPSEAHKALEKLLS